MNLVASLQVDGALETSITSTSKIPFKYNSTQIDSIKTSRSQCTTKFQFQIQNSKVLESSNKEYGRCTYGRHPWGF